MAPDGARLEAEDQASRQLHVVARLSILQLAAQTLEPRHVVARLDADAEPTVRLPDVEPDGAVAERIRLRAGARDVTKIVRSCTAPDPDVWTRRHARPAREIARARLESEIVLIEIDLR